MRKARFLAALALLTGPTLSFAQMKPLFDFPTENKALVTGDFPAFFMYINRDFQGEKSHPWEGGQYGFVRGPKIRGGNIVYAQMHEGIDICPLDRDAAGNPTDAVKAAAAGTVVYVSLDARASNYGRYVVIEHRIDGSPIYTLYAHLASILVKPGETVRQGQQVGVLGFTGDGIDRTRAHVHFEVAMMLSRNFEAWYQQYLPRDPNRHGIYNGRNLVGIDPARLLLAAQRNPQFDLKNFILSGEVCYKIHVPNVPSFDLLKLYPWLAGAAAKENPPSWTVSFSRYGVPVKIEPFASVVGEPRLAGVQPAPVDYATWTRGIVTGSTANPQLSDSGKRFADLLIYPDLK